MQLGRIVPTYPAIQSLAQILSYIYVKSFLDMQYTYMSRCVGAG